MDVLEEIPRGIYALIHLGGNGEETTTSEVDENYEDRDMGVVTTDSAAAL